MNSSPQITSPSDRLIKGSSVETIVQAIAQFYGVGEVLHYSEISVGYEDCNVIIKTATGKYVAKLFAHTRTAADIDRYVEIMRQIAQAGVRHPELIAGGHGEYVLHHAGVWVVLANFIEGKTYYELGRAPSTTERRAILDEVVKINAINHQPSYVASSWAPSKFYAMLDQVRPYLSEEESIMIEKVAQCYDELPFEQFKRTFTHCDLRTTNILVDPDGVLYVLDYFLANHFSRIQELAVMIATLFYDASSSSTLQELCDQVASDYGQLDAIDLQHLPHYTLVAVAMEFLGGTYARHIQFDVSVENTYWLERGRGGLAKFISEA